MNKTLRKVSFVLFAITLISLFSFSVYAADLQDVRTSFTDGGGYFGDALVLVGDLLGEDGLNFMLAFFGIFAASWFCFGMVGRLVYSQEESFFKGLTKPFSFFLALAGAGFVFFQNIDVLGIVGPYAIMIAVAFGVIMFGNIILVLTNKTSKAGFKFLWLGISMIVMGAFAVSIIPGSSPSWMTSAAVWVVIAGVVVTLIGIGRIVWKKGTGGETGKGTFGKIMDASEAEETAKKLKKSAKSGGDVQKDIEGLDEGMGDAMSHFKDVSKFDFLDRWRRKAAEKELNKLKALYKTTATPNAISASGVAKVLDEVETADIERLAISDHKEILKANEKLRSLMDYDFTKDEKEVKNYIVYLLEKKHLKKYSFEENPIKKGQKIWQTIMHFAVEVKSPAYDFVNKRIGELQNLFKQIPDVKAIEREVKTVSDSLMNARTYANLVDKRKEEVKDYVLHNPEGVDVAQLQPQILQLLKDFDRALNAYDQAKYSCAEFMSSGSISEYFKKFEGIKKSIDKTFEAFGKEFNSSAKKYFEGSKKVVKTKLAANQQQLEDRK